MMHCGREGSASQNLSFVLPQSRREDTISWEPVFVTG
jgi:hypothetical protein